MKESCSTVSCLALDSQKAFARYDVNNNGHIDVRELKNLLTDLQWDATDETVSLARERAVCVL